MPKSGMFGAGMAATPENNGQRRKDAKLFHIID
jgi:hypothetical protein